MLNRLKQHAKSIDSVTNLQLVDFYCKYLVLQDIWIGLGESLFIDYTKPLWNVVADGFGNHDPGKERHTGQKPQWDMIHPGRDWASRLQPNKKSSDEVIDNILRFLAGDVSAELADQIQAEEADSDQE